MHMPVKGDRTSHPLTNQMKCSDDDRHCCDEKWWQKQERIMNTSR